MAGKKIVDEAKDAASAVTKKTKDAVTKTAAKGAKAAKDAAASGADAAKGATKAAAKTATKAAAKGKDAAKGALGAAAGILGKVKDKATDMAGDVVDGAKNVAENAGETVGKVTKGAKAAAAKAADTVKDVAEDAGEVAAKAVKGAKDAAENVVEGAKDLAHDAAQKVGDVAEDVTDALKGGVEKIGGVGVAALGVGAAAVGGVAAAAGDLGKGAAELADKGLDAAHDVAEKGATLAKDAIGGVADLGKSAAAGVSDAASGLVAEGKKGGGFLIPLLLVIAVGGLGWYGLNKMGAKTETPAVTAEVKAEQPSWLGGIVDGLKAKFPWLSLKMNGSSLIASGEAADKNAKDAALADLSIALETSEGKGTSVIDDIKVAGSTEAPIGAALAALGENPDAAACTKAFTDTMAGRTINFATGAAKINDDSANLLNVLTGIASTCKAHKIEVAGHTDARGNADSNLTLSQARADAVKAFWVDKGVPAEGLTAKGYGSTKPLDPAATEEAYAKNRRTEFTVTD